MNKEECLLAYRHLVNEAYSRWWNYHGKSAKPGYLEFGKPMYKGDCKALLLIKQLIEEHFDNPSLNYTEIEEGKWYWHNKKKEWVKVLNKEVCTSSVPIIETINEYIEFELNCFYRKQVEE